MRTATVSGSWFAADRQTADGSKKTEEVDVAGVVELEGAVLAHGDAEEARGRARRTRPRPRRSAARPRPPCGPPGRAGGGRRAASANRVRAAVRASRPQTPPRSQSAVSRCRSPLSWRKRRLATSYSAIPQRLGLGQDIGEAGVGLGRQDGFEPGRRAGRQAGQIRARRRRTRRPGRAFVSSSNARQPPRSATSVRVSNARAAALGVDRCGPQGRSSCARTSLPLIRLSAGRGRHAEACGHDLAHPAGAFVDLQPAAMRLDHRRRPATRPRPKPGLAAELFSRPARKRWTTRSHGRPRPRRDRCR